jgi:hypothetical protein
VHAVTWHGEVTRVGNICDGADCRIFTLARRYRERLFARVGRDNVVQKPIPGFNTKCSPTINLTVLTRSLILDGRGGAVGGDAGKRVSGECTYFLLLGAAVWIRISALPRWLSRYAH